jgi:hypothetical protein
MMELGTQHVLRALKCTARGSRVASRVAAHDADGFAMCDAAGRAVVDRP